MPHVSERHSRGVAQQEEPKHEDPSAIGWQVWRTLDPSISAKINPRLWRRIKGEVTPTHLDGGDVASLPLCRDAQTGTWSTCGEQPDLQVLESQVFANADQRTVDLSSAAHVDQRESSATGAGPGRA
ncbi:MAG: hypothetical protein R2851_25810 [Caldilineaceae bacterium]